MNKIKNIIFTGTSDFGLPSLKAIYNHPQFKLVAVITQPDKKAGRNLQIIYSPIKEFALKHNVKILQPQRIIEARNEIIKLSPDFIVVAAYAQIIPEDILAIPNYGCINIHASLLPYCRGASCLQGPLLDGKDKTGVTLILMDAGLDTGPILAQKTIKIEDHDTAGSLHDKLAELATHLVLPTLEGLINGRIKPREQSHDNVSYVPRLTKKDGHINFSQTAKQVNAFIRAMTPWPSAFAFFQESSSQEPKRFKIIATKVSDLALPKLYKVGYLFALHNKLYVQCQDSALEILLLQIEGSKEISADDFINGYGHYLNITLR